MKGGALKGVPPFVFPGPRQKQDLLASLLMDHRCHPYRDRFLCEAVLTAF
jgi:hypothetical protein